MKDDDRVVDRGSTTGVPAPRPVPDRDARSGPPGTRRQWVTAIGQVSGLLLALREVEGHGAVLPHPLAHGAALRAWAAVTRPVLRDPARLTFPDARPMDLALVGRTARVLGGVVCREWVTGTGNVVTAMLRREAAVHEREPEWLVAQVARVHGTLTAAGPASARMVWRALDDDDTAPASRDAEPTGS